MDGYDVRVEVLGDKILHEITSQFAGRREVIMRGLIDLSDRKIQEALVGLGWTPPSGSHLGPVGSWTTMIQRKIRDLDDAQGLFVLEPVEVGITPDETLTIILTGRRRGAANITQYRAGVTKRNIGPPHWAQATVLAQEAMQNLERATA